MGTEPTHSGTSVLIGQDPGFERGTPLLVRRGFQLLGERSTSPSPGAMGHWGAAEPPSGGPGAPAATRRLRARALRRDQGAAPLRPHLRGDTRPWAGGQPRRVSRPFARSPGFGAVSKGVSRGRLLSSDADLRAWG